VSAVSDATIRVRLRNPDRTVEFAGPATAGEVLDRLDILPHTVLVIADRELVTADRLLPAGSEVEVRPVVSGGAESAPRCVVCRQPAVHEEARHRAAWCAVHYPDHVLQQIRKAIDRPPTRPAGERMFHYGQRLLVAVSGGKDSLALWDALVELGYQADGLYVGLGIGGYSSRSREICEAFAEERSLRLHVVDLAERYGYTTPSGAGATGRSTCGVCGLSKRHAFDQVALEEGYDVLLTGHNLDDEAATLLGNVLRWDEGFLARQRPVLVARSTGQRRKCKPMYRLSERETAAYCVVRGIDYVVEECPLVDGNTGQELKTTLDLLEGASPGIKAQFLFGFLDRAAEHFDDDLSDPSSGTGGELGDCRTCGMPTPNDICAFCRQREAILAVLPLATTGART
jgi:tRNA-5-methyluridine54 2-sulfurtransferase